MTADFRIKYAIALAMALGGCARPSATSGPTELALWKHQAGETEEAANTEAIARFNASQSRWHITAQSLPQGAYSQSVVAASMAGRMPCVLTVDQPMVASFVWGGHIRPIDDLVPAETLAPVSASGKGTYRSRIYSVGQFDAALALFTRRSALAAIDARVPTLDRPWTLPEFDGILARLKATGRYTYPLDLSTRDTKADWWTYAFSPILQGFGGDLIDRTIMRADGTLNGPQAQAFATWFRSLFVSDYVNRREPDENAFVKGRAAMAYTGNWWAPDYRARVGDDLLILPPPDFGRGAVIGGGSWQWAVSRSCPHPTGAGEFIRFMMQPREIAAMADAAGMVPVTEAGAALSVDFRPGGKSRIFFDLMQRFARSRPATPAFSMISSSFFGAMRDIMDGADPQDALDDAADAIDQSIADNRGYRAAPPLRRRSGSRRFGCRPMMIAGRKRTSGARMAMLLGAPALLGLLVFVVVPFVLALLLTFTDQRLVSPEAGRFVGLRNYQRLLSVSYIVQSPLTDSIGKTIVGPDGRPAYDRVRSITRTDPAYRDYRPMTEIFVGRRRIAIVAKDPAFLGALINTFAFAAMVVPLQCFVALSLALLVNAGLRGQTLFRAIYFSPVVMSMVVVSIVWAFLFDRDLGLFNTLLSLLSFGSAPRIDWLGNPHTAMPAIVIMSAWQGAGFQMLIFLAGLQGISQELYDAARIDGATAWQRFRHVTLPGLRQTIAFVMIVTTIAALGLFTQVDVMTQGGPQGATSTVMFHAIQRGVREENIAYGSTVSVVYFVLIAGLILIQQALQRRWSR
ncbi:extracellular solute-binding protein [Sphingomonas aliaeris]|uniref:Extracellular solute-binding protein n=1 Tax=Sphingomonas aliaeris TaxID=2759526 RepID=A0A974S4J5_9SPHN|nr:extracellular solute-binding protein [Sphingomonas aliaeris]QQV77637.1 extracellular solute-binding protein [Sphingomonas aliaeris]